MTVVNPLCAWSDGEVPITLTKFDFARLELRLARTNAGLKFTPEIHPCC